MAFLLKSFRTGNVIRVAQQIEIRACYLSKSKDLNPNSLGLFCYICMEHKCEHREFSNETSVYVIEQK